MTLGFAFFTFLNAWWIMLFIAVPFSTEYKAEDKQSLDYAAAPTRIRWKKAFVIATILACVVTLGLALLFKSGIVEVKAG